MSVHLLLLLAACKGGDDAKTPVAPAAGSSVPAALVSQAWQVRLAKDEARAPFEGRASWTAYFQGKRAEALQAMAGESDPDGMARMRAEYAAIYWQLALAESNALVEVYEKDRQPTDPVETKSLVWLAHGIRGETVPEPALDHKPSASEVMIQMRARGAQAKTWPGPAAMTAMDLPPELILPGDVLPGANASADAYALVGEPGAVALGDPADLVTLSCWHRTTDTCPIDADAIVAPDDPAAATDAWLFMSPYTSAADMAFLKAVAKDPGAVDTWADKSAYAAIAKTCSKGGKISPDCVLDESVALGSAIEAAMQAASGKEEGFYRSFADYARAGVLRAGDRVAKAQGDADTMGRLRILALDKQTGAARDPVFLTFVIAWDAGNRNTVRATQLLHELESDVPGIHVARSAVDALHIRLSRNAAPGLPMN